MRRNRIISVRFSEADVELVDRLSRELDDQGELNAPNYRLRSTRSSTLLNALYALALDKGVQLPHLDRRGRPAKPPAAPEPAAEPAEA